MKDAAGRLMIAGLVGCALLMLCAGCSCPAPQQTVAAPEATQGATSLLDVMWAYPEQHGGLAGPSLESARLASPTAYSEAQKGRVVPEAIPKLPPLALSEIHYPALKELPPLDVQTPVRAPKPVLTDMPDITQPPAAKSGG